MHDKLVDLIRSVVRAEKAWHRLNQDELIVGRKGNGWMETNHREVEYDVEFEDIRIAIENLDKLNDPIAFVDWAQFLIMTSFANFEVMREKENGEPLYDLLWSLSFGESNSIDNIKAFFK
jgi:hypothetical protein